MHSIAEASGTADMDQADMVRVVSMAMHTTGDTGHSPLSSLAVAATHTAACYLELSHWRKFRPSRENSTSSAYSVSSWWKYVGAPCFRPDYDGFA